MSTKLFIGGFPIDSTELELAQLISLYGDIDTIKIVRDKKTRKCKGYAFIELADLKSAQNAVEALDGTMLDNRMLTLNIVPDNPVIPNANQPVQPKYVKVEKPSIHEKKKRPRKQL